MRLGWDDKNRNAAELAKRAEAEGVKMITVHGRTRCQFFTGIADWSAVRAVVDATSLPVLVNGDILSPDHARDALEASGAKGVMIGRGAYGAPWMPGRIAKFLATGRDPGNPAPIEQRDIAVEHIETMLGHYGRELGLRNARKHIGWYLASSGASDTIVKSWRRKLCVMLEPQNVIDGLKAFYSGTESLAA
jgi:tRNA-dihydrouridine synthase